MSHHSLDHSISSINSDDDDLISNKKIYLGLAFTAAICFTICNFALVELTNGVGPFAILYFASGSVFTSSFFYVIRSSKNVKSGKKCWSP